MVWNFSKDVELLRQSTVDLGAIRDDFRCDFFKKCNSHGLKKCNQENCSPTQRGNACAETKILK